jgi:splicing factor 1
MAWRNQGITGSNNIPLGKMRRFGPDGEEDFGSNGAPSSNDYSNGTNGANGTNGTNGDRDIKRGRSPERTSFFS